MKVKELVEMTAKATANQMMEKLKKENRIKGYNLNSFKRTEELLYLYPKLKSDSKERRMINNALDKVKDDEYYPIIEYRYFEGMAFEKIADLFETKRQTVSNHRCRLVKEIAKELFPEEVAREIIES